ncbi:MAG: RdgB/HAM1 family non-canonical purine NTP pyrophosphatase [Bacteroidota bacterium]
MKTRIFFGTNNPNKLREIADLLPEQFELVSFRDLDEPLEVEEPDPTLEGNAAIKANAFHAHTGLPCFSDDTGLEVEAIGGLPGVRSARYAGPDGNAEANMSKLLAALEGKANRSAQFRTVIAYHDGKEVHFFEGVVKGSIRAERSGTEGFGYDPIFQPDGHTITFAEMDKAEKNQISHRGRAIRKFIAYLESVSN